MPLRCSSSVGDNFPDKLIIHAHQGERKRVRAANKEQSALTACRGGGGRTRARDARRAYSAPRTPWQGGADTDECRLRSAPRMS